MTAATFDMRPVVNNQSLAANRYGEMHRFQGAPVSYSATFVWAGISGTTNAQFIVQVTNKPNPDEADDDDWETKTSWTMTGSESAAGQKTISIDLIHEAFCRVKVAKGDLSGGTIDVYATAKKRGW